MQFAMKGDKSMDKFLESMGLITGTVKELEDINNECFLNDSADRQLIPNRKEVVKVIKDLQSLLFPDYACGAGVSAL